MTRAISTSLTALLALAAPAVAQAGPGASLRQAELQAATGTLRIEETRCPPGAQPGSADCGRVSLDAKFESPRRPATRAVAGRPGFTAGFRISGSGSGQCSAESPTTVLTGPDGSVQFLAGSARIEPGRFGSTRIVVAQHKRGLRVAWLEPLAPALDCDYFGEPSTALALPAGDKLPAELVSPLIGARTLARSRFSITIAGSKDWLEQDEDGTKVDGSASWRLRLDYRN